MEIDLQLYSRQRLLSLEKELAEHHRQLALIKRDVEIGGPQEAAESVEAALWQLGVAIIRVAESQGLTEA